jgi:hypothetical protein
VFWPGHQGEHAALQAAIFRTRQVQMAVTLAGQKVNAVCTVLLQSLNAVVVSVKNSDHAIPSRATPT